MKKYFLIMAAVVAVTLTGCNQSSNNEYESKAKDLAQRMDEACQKQDTAAVLEMDKMIRAQQKEIEATGDTAAIKIFRETLKEARERSAAFVTVSKMDAGVEEEKAVEQVINDVMNGDVDIHAVTSSVDAALEKKK